MLELLLAGRRDLTIPSNGWQGLLLMAIVFFGIQPCYQNYNQMQVTLKKMQQYLSQQHLGS